MFKTLFSKLLKTKTDILNEHLDNCIDFTQPFSFEGYVIDDTTLYSDEFLDLGLPRDYKEYIGIN